jgi:hypothetical protein
VQIDQFDAGNERIAASPWAFNTNGILYFVGHSFILRNGLLNGTDIFLRLSKCLAQTTDGKK